MHMEMELDLFLGNGNVWYAGPTNAGLHVPVVVDVLNLGAPSPTPLLVALQHMSLWRFLVVVPHLWSLVGLLLPLVPVPGLVFGPIGKAPSPEGQQGSSDSQSGWVHFSCAWLQAPSSWCWCWFSAAWSLFVHSSRQRACGPASCSSAWPFPGGLSGFFDECACFAW